jgi:hypothetical protein
MRDYSYHKFINKRPKGQNCQTFISLFSIAQRIWAFQQSPIEWEELWAGEENACQLVPSGHKGNHGQIGTRFVQEIGQR